MFVATANTLNIPPALLDRMEVIRLAGYTEDEKVNIALRYLLPKQEKNNGIRAGELEVTEQGVRGIVRYYTREAGVRSLEREISKICRKVVKAIQLKQVTDKVTVVEDNLNDYLGVRKFDYGQAEKENQVGQVVGLAWTEVGGDLLTIEAAVMPGKGNILRTGQLGEVMKESVEAARSVVRSPLAAARHQGRPVREEGHPHSRSRRCDSEGRPERWRRDDDGVRVGADRNTGSRACCDDWGDHLAWRSHRHRWPQGKAAGPRGVAGSRPFSSPRTT